MRDGPNKLRKHHKEVLVKLDKSGIELDSNGEIKYSAIPHQSLLRYVKDNEMLIKTVLMQRDLEFEYPMKLEKKLVKGDLLKMVDEEEEKLKKYVEVENEKREKRIEEQLQGYEDHFRQFKDEYGYSDSKGTTSYESFVEKQASPYMFENDLLEQTFKFWESDIERYERVKKIWLDLKRKNALGGLDAIPTHEYDRTVRDVVKKIRDLRFKVD